MTLTSTLTRLQTVQDAKDNPIGFVVDLILEVIISAIIPIPLAAKVLVRYKKMVLWSLAGVFLLGLTLVVMVISIITSPATYVLTQPISITSAFGSQLQNYIEAGFTDTNIPNRDPLGGNGFANSIITFDYHQTGYGFFNGVHEGIDLYPTLLYFLTNKAYLATRQIIVFATLNGTGKFYVDQYGSNTVEITNSDNSLKTIDMHLAASFISTGQTVKAGEPLGIMGATGEATGVHLQYQIDVLNNGTWTPTDPKGYIN